MLPSVKKVNSTTIQPTCNIIIYKPFSYQIRPNSFLKVKVLFHSLSRSVKYTMFYSFMRGCSIPLDLWVDLYSKMRNKYGVVWTNSALRRDLWGTDINKICSSNATVDNSWWSKTFILYYLYYSIHLNNSQRFYTFTAGNQRSHSPYWTASVVQLN